MASSMHTHISAQHAVNTFLAVVVIGTFWRIGASALVRRFPEGSFLNSIGQAAAAQF